MKVHEQPSAEKEKAYQDYMNVTCTVKLTARKKICFIFSHF